MITFSGSFEDSNLGLGYILGRILWCFGILGLEELVHAFGLDLTWHFYLCFELLAFLRSLARLKRKN